MSSVRRLVTCMLGVVGLLGAGALVVPVASAAEPVLTTFVVQLSADSEVPPCQAGVESSASGRAVVQINADTGEITYRVVAFNLPASAEPRIGVHIHVQDPNSPTGLTGPIVLHLQLTGRNTGLVAAGTTTDPERAAALLADPGDFYIDVHTTACPTGTVRGPLG
jgi:hypothetical protein